MKECTVPNATPVERALFSTDMLIEKPSSEVCYTVKLIGRPRREPDRPGPSDVKNPEDWDNRLITSTRGEWYAHVLRGSRKVLDIGCGSGFPSLYLARSIPEVVGVDPGTCEIEAARETQRYLGLRNITFLQESALTLPFGDSAFDGACFCTSLESTGDPEGALEEARRVIKPGGALAVELQPYNEYLRGRGRWERMRFFVTDDKLYTPIAQYSVMTSSPVSGRTYMVHLKPKHNIGHRARNTVLNQDAPPTIEGREVIECLTKSQFSMVERVEYYRVRGFEPKAFHALLEATGFNDIGWWVYPSGPEFARGLEEQGLLGNLENDQLIPYIRALVRASRTDTAIGDCFSAVNAKQ